MNILMFGSRDWNNYDIVLNVTKRLILKYGDITIIEGGCKGADLLTKKVAIDLNLDYQEFLADWKQLGKKAGPIRNQMMIDEGKPHMAICFHNDIENSKGSKDMRNRLTKHKIPWQLITEND